MMRRHGDYQSRPEIIASAVLATIAAAAAVCVLMAEWSYRPILYITGPITIVSVVLLVIGSLGDPENMWALFAILWLSTWAKLLIDFAVPEPFWYRGVLVRRGIVSSSTHVRGLARLTCTFSEAMFLPLVKGGAMSSAGAAVGMRVGLGLYFLIAPRICYTWERRWYESTFGSEEKLLEHAKLAVWMGLVDEYGRIKAHNVFEAIEGDFALTFQAIVKHGKRIPGSKLSVPVSSAYKKAVRGGASPCPCCTCCV
jgi:hypothetical protein